MTADPQTEFLKLLDAERWGRLQGHFSRVLGLTLRTLSPDRTLLVEPSWPLGLDVQQITELFHLGEELDELLPLDAELQQTAVSSRALGVSFAAIPLRASVDQILAYLVVGPVVLGQRERMEAFKERVAALGVDPDSAWVRLLTVKLYSFSAFKSVLSFLEEASDTLLELAYSSHQIKTIVPEADKVDRLVLKHYTQRLCHSLLEVAATATKADGGSVMLLEEGAQTYRIAAARGLSDEVSATTQIPLGNGIAGLAAERREILLVDDRVKDPVVRERMKRPEISSSLVAPIAAESSGQPPLAVLNLRIGRSETRFTEEDADFIRKLMELAESAFTNISPKYEK